MYPLQSCPECNSDYVITTKFEGLLACEDCGEIFEDDAEEVENIRTSLVRKNNKAEKHMGEDD